MNGTSDGIRVLHVDDASDFADMAATFLERTDDRLAVQTATRATDGLDILDDRDVDCIVSDYDMPGQNGIEFLRTVREEFPDLPFILYTGKGSEEVASDAISAGVTDYVQKRGGTDQYTVLANRIVNAVESYRSQQELAERNRELRRYKHLINSMREAACVYDEDGRFVIVNEYLANWYDTTREALEGEYSNLIPSIREQTDEGDPYRALLDGRRDQLSGEIEAEFPRHGYAVLAYRLTPLMVDGAVEGVVGVARDVTEQKDRERKLRRNKRAMDEAPVGVTITDSDREDNPLIYANRRFQELTGYSEEEVLGRNCRFLQGEATDPEPVATMRKAVDRAERVSVELRNYRKDGTEFWNRVSIAPVRDDDGSVVNYVGFQQDVTERTERERQQETTIEFLQSLYDVATDRSLDVTEKVTRLLELGPEQLGLPSGYLTWIGASDEAAETRIQRVIEASGDHELLQPGDSCPLSHSYCRKTIEADGVVTIQDALAAGWEGDPAYELFNLGCYIGTTTTVNDDLYGTVFFASETPREEPFTDAERTYVRLVSRLVSYELERDHARQELEQQNERLEEFASIVSHDLRNPLRVAEGRLELAREECDSDHLDGIGDALTRSQALIDDLLTLAREGDEVNNLEPVDLGALTESCWHNVETAEASLLKETERTVQADRSRLQQLLENLYRNAVEHGGDDVTVTIDGLTDGFYIEDDGPGIRTDNRDRVFDTGYSTTDDGTGFGLSIVEQIVDAHGWEIRVTEGPEGGARFEITGVEFSAE